jgi:hypothetical protein
VQVFAGDADAAGRRLLLAQREAQERRLAGPGRPDEEDELALLDLEGQAVQRCLVLRRIQLADVVEKDHDASPMWM